MKIDHMTHNFLKELLPYKIPNTGHKRNASAKAVIGRLFVQ